MEIFEECEPVILMLSCELKKAEHMAAGLRALMTCLLFKYLYFFLCDGKLLPKNTLLKVGGPDGVGGSHGFFPSWVKHFNASLNRVPWAPVPIAL